MTLADIIELAGYPGTAEDLRGDYTPEELLVALHSLRDTGLAHDPDKNEELIEIVEAWIAGRDLQQEKP